MLLDDQGIAAMTTRRRAAFANSLGGFKSANHIDTVNSGAVYN
ncbi:MAG: hypothetical protein ACI9JM_003070 [Halioglobus sp.]|jgi:hypothetical protein